MNLNLESVADPNVVLPGQSTPSTANAAAAGAAVNPPAAAAAPANAAARPATYHELKAALPTADAAFIVSQQECNATVGQAQAAYMAAVAAENLAQKAEIQELKKSQSVAAAAAPAKKPGAPSVPAAASSTGAHAEDGGGDAIATWNAACEQLMTERKFTKAQATRLLCIERPELQAAYNAAYTQINAPKIDRAKK